jgi:antibiotic biosynthesis monooxygenase (ABM) superfamily enzyme
MRGLDPGGNRHVAIHVAIIRRVRQGCEAEFEEALRDFFRSSLADTGVLGVHMLTPPPNSGTREYGILRTFKSDSEREAFYRSPLFSAWQERVAPLVEGEPEYRELTGLEAWFRIGRTLPPRWKMAAVTLLGVYPTSLALSLTLGKIVRDWPMALASLVLSASMVVLLTWVVMPAITRVLHSWIHLGIEERRP